MQARPVLGALALALMLSGCVHQPFQKKLNTSPVLEGDPTHPGATKGWVETRLYFGLGPVDQVDKGVSEAEWRAFLDREVTPRFPNGLSVVDVYGQWQGKSQPGPERLRSKCVIINYPDAPEARKRIEEIRAAWKHKTGDQSVMRVTEPADVSF